MAVAHDAASNYGASGHSGSGSFSWTHTPVGTPAGVLVGVVTIAAAPEDLSVTYGGVPMHRNDAVGSDTATEPGSVVPWFLGEGIPTGAQTVEVTRTNSATVMWAAAATVTAGADTEMGGRYFVIQNNSSWIEEPVDDGSPGTNSMRYAFGYTGAAAPIGVGANSTSLSTIDFGAFGAMFCRETTAGQGSRLVGFDSAGGSDDNATFHVGIRERPAAAIVHDVASKPAGVVGIASVASFSWEHPAVGTPAAVEVQVVTVASSPVDTSVDYGGVSMTLDTALTASTAGPEPGTVRVYVLTAGIPAGPQTITVNRTNNATVSFATAASQRAFGGTAEVYSTGAVIVNTIGTEIEQSPTDASPGTPSVRYAAVYSGTTGGTQGTNTVQFTVINLTLRDYRLGWEIIGGQGARPVGFDAASDDRAGTYYAVRLVATSTGTGSFTGDAVVLATRTSGLTADAVIKASRSGSLTTDATLAATRTGSFTASAALKRAQTGSFTADAVVPGSPTGSFTGDAVVKRAQASSLTAAALLLKTATGSFTANATERRTQTGSLTANAVKKRTITGSFTANAVVGDGTLGFTADAVIGDSPDSGPTTRTRSFPADAVFAKTTTSSFTVDAVYLKTIFRADAAIKAPRTGSFAASAVFKTGFSGSLTADAHFAYGFEGSFSADALIRSDAGTGSFTVNYATWSPATGGNSGPGTGGNGPGGTPPMFGVPTRIFVNGVELANEHVIWKTATFKAQVNTGTGLCDFDVLDRDHSLTFKTGDEIQLYIDGILRWGGWVLQVTRQFPFPVVADPALKPRIFHIAGVDYNRFLDRRILHDSDNPGRTWDYPPGTADNTIFNNIWPYFDTDGFTKNIRHVGDGVLDIPGVTSRTAGSVAQGGFSMRDVLMHLSWDTGAIYYVTPSKVVTYVDADLISNPYVLTDEPTAGTSFSVGGDDDFQRTESGQWGTGPLGTWNAIAGVNPSVTPGAASFGDADTTFTERVPLDPQFADGFFWASSARFRWPTAFSSTVNEFHIDFVDSSLGTRLSVTANVSQIRVSYVTPSSSGDTGFLDLPTPFDPDTLAVIALEWDLNAATLTANVWPDGGSQPEWTVLTGVLATPGDFTDFNFEVGAETDENRQWVVEDASAFADGSNPPDPLNTGYHDVSMLEDSTEMVNDAIVWGAGKGSSQVVVSRYQSTSSQDTHGRWQAGDFTAGIYKQATADAVAEARVEGSPESLRGAKNPKRAVKLLTWNPVFGIGDVVAFHNSQFNYDDVLPIRTMTVTWPTPYDPLFELQLSWEIDAVWSFFDPWLPVGAPGDGPGPGLPPGGQEAPTACLEDDFDRPNGPPGTATSGQTWVNGPGSGGVFTIESLALKWNSLADNAQGLLVLPADMPVPLSGSFLIQDYTVSGGGGFTWTLNGGAAELTAYWDATNTGNLYISIYDNPEIPEDGNQVFAYVTPGLFFTPLNMTFTVTPAGASVTVGSSTATVLVANAFPNPIATIDLASNFSFRGDTDGGGRIIFNDLLICPPNTLGGTVPPGTIVREGLIPVADPSGDPPTYPGGTIWQSSNAILPGALVAVDEVVLDGGWTVVDAGAGTITIDAPVVATSTVTVTYVSTGPVVPPTEEVTEGTLVPVGSLEAAVAAADPGDVLLLRQGTHYLDDILYIDKALTLLNYGSERAEITSTGRPELVFFTAGPILVRGLVFSGLGGYGDVHGSALASMQAGSHDVTIDACEFWGASDMGATQQIIYHHAGGSNAAITNCLIDGRGSGGFGVHLYPGPGPNNVLVQNNLVRNFPEKSGILVWTDSGGIQILDNRISNCSSAVRHHNSNGTYVNGNVGEGGLGTGLEIDSAANLTVGTNNWGV